MNTGRVCAVALALVVSAGTLQGRAPPAAPLPAVPAPADAGEVILVPLEAPTIQDAIRGAAPGAIIRVDAGNYGESLRVIGKGVTLVAHGGAVVVETFRVSGVPASESVVVDGFHALATAFSGHPGLRATDNDGPLRFTRCTFRGAGLDLGDGWCALFDCIIRGGKGGRGETFIGTAYGGEGGAGLQLRGARVQAHGSYITGGDGGSGFCSSSCVIAYGGEGGDGVVGPGADAELTSRDSVFEGGNGGGTQGMGPTGADGSPVALPPGSFLRFEAAHRSFSASSAVREGDTLRLAVGGTPGDVILLSGALDGAHVEMPTLQGAWLLGSPLVISDLLLGVVPAGGSLQLQTPAPDLPPGVAGANLHLQIAVSGSELLLGPLAVVTLLDRGD